MKKLLLLLFACIASIGAWAQNNLVTNPVGDGVTKEVTASFSALPAAEGADGNSGSRWGSEGGSDTEWFQIHWSAAQTFNTVKILCEGAMNAANAPKLAFDIQVSNDGANWTTKKHVFGENAGNNEYITVVFNEPATAAYVRFQGVTKGNYGYSFFEFEVYNIDYSGSTLASIELKTNGTTVRAEETLAVSAIGKDSDGKVIPTGTIEWTSTASVYGAVANETFSGLSAGSTTISATAGSVTSNTKDITVTPAIPAVPTTVGSNKKGIFSAELGNTAGYGFQDWGGGTGESTTIKGVAVYQISNFRYFGSGFTVFYADGYEKLHIDVYPDFTGTLTIVPICEPAGVRDPEKGTQFNVTANTWNSLELNIADLIDVEGVSMQNLFQIKYTYSIASKNSKGATDGFNDADGTKSFFVGNVYLYGTASDDSTPPTMTKAVVTTVGANTAMLTVSATDNRSLLTYTVKKGETIIGTGNGTQGADATVMISGLTAETTYPAGTFKVTATDAVGNVSAAYDVPEITTTAKPMGETVSATITSENPSENGKTLNYTWVFTQSGTTVTVTFGYANGLNQDYQGIVGFVDGVTIHDGTEAGGLSYTWENCTVGQTLTAQHKWLFNGGDFYTPIFTYVVAGDNAGLVKEPADANGVCEILGTGAVTAEAFEDLTAITEKAYNLTNLKITSPVALTAKNKNAVFIVKADQKITLAGTNNLLVWSDANNRYESGLITITDQPDADNLFASNLDIYTTDAAYVRKAVGANQYFTVALPFAATVPSGFSAYTAGEAGASVTFTKVDGGAMSAHTPYVVHNVSNSAADFTVTATGVNALLDFTETTQNCMKSAFTKITTGSETTDTYVLMADEGDAGRVVFHAAKGVTIIPFRAYFVGSMADGARAIFVDEDATAIDAIRDAETVAGDGAYYDLAGRRVLNPTKGIFIHNGKKVVIK